MPVLDFTLEGRSLMNARNSKGPRTLPCGTPKVTGVVSEQEPSSTTCCVQIINSVPLINLLFVR